jgi:hypothetical protein
MAKITKKGAKLKAWQVCSKYVRTLHSRDGICTCYTCGVSKPISAMQAGHAIQGRGNSILFETDGIRPQCAGCNVWQGGRLDIFIPKLIDEIGRERYDELLALKGQPKKYSLEDYLDLYQEFKEKLEEL